MSNNDGVGLDLNLDRFDQSKVVKGSGNNNKPLLTIDSDCKFLRDIAVAHDNRNFGMSRQEMISIIAELKGSPVTTATAKNHYLHRLTTSIHQSLCLLVLVFSCNKLIVGLGNLGCVALLFDDEDLI